MSSVSLPDPATSGKARDTTEFLSRQHYNAPYSDVSLALPPVAGWGEETDDIKMTVLEYRDKIWFNVQKRNYLSLRRTSTEC